MADQGYRASKDVRVVSDKSIEADIVYTVAAQGNRGMQLGFLWCGNGFIRQMAMVGPVPGC